MRASQRYCFHCGKMADHGTKDHVDPPNLFNPISQETTAPSQRPVEDIEATALARASDPDTSQEAAAKLSAGRAGTMKRELLYAFGGFLEHPPTPLTAEEAATRAGYKAEDGAWKRVSDLLSLGLLEDTGERRTGSQGRRQRVLRITEAGRRALAATSREAG
jgi:hypothetical protein